MFEQQLSLNLIVRSTLSVLIWLQDVLKTHNIQVTGNGELSPSLNSVQSVTVDCDWNQIGRMDVQMNEITVDWSTVSRMKMNVERGRTVEMANTLKLKRSRVVKERNTL